MNKKFLTVLFFAFGIYVLDACCGEYKPHFDYSGLRVRQFPPIPELAPLDTMKLFEITATGISYLAGVYLPVASNRCYGTSCPESGDEGPKHKFQSIEVTSDQTFNDTLPAGASLNALFYHWIGDATSARGQQLTQPTPEFDFGFYYASLFIGTPHLPKDSTQAYTFHVKITKSDGSVAQGSVSGVTFR